MTQSRLQALSAFVVAFVSVALSLSSVHAASVISTGSGNWNDGGNWSPAVPTSGDDVAIATGHSITITGLQTIAINSLSITGTLTHGNNSSTEAHKIILNIANNCTADSVGKIDAKGLGYDAHQGPGNPVDGHSYTGGSIYITTANLGGTEWRV